VPRHPSTTRAAQSKYSRWRFRSQPSGGLGYELDTIAAVVIGGASLAGGVGSIFGTLMGVLTIGVLRNGLNLIGTSPFVQQIVIGVVIVLAVESDVLRARLEERFRVIQAALS